jgi:hypothetical protein
LGKKSFETLYKEFIASSSGGKVFMMKKYEENDTFLGKGVIILLRKTSLFMLTILKEQYLKDKNSMIGDIDLLFALVKKKQRKQRIQHNLKRIQNFIKAPKRQIQLYAILRKHKSLKPIKFKINFKKREEK